MDAIEFIKEYQRMCSCYANCINCPCNNLNCCDLDTDSPEKLVKIVEDWSKAYPLKTIAQDFLQKYPNVEVFNGVPKSCAANLGFSIPSYCSCKVGQVGQEDCCKKCWNRPLED